MAESGGLIHSLFYGFEGNYRISLDDVGEPARAGWLAWSWNFAQRQLDPETTKRKHAQSPLYISPLPGGPQQSDQRANGRMGRDLIASNRVLQGLVGSGRVVGW